MKYGPGFILFIILCISCAQANAKIDQLCSMGQADKGGHATVDLLVYPDQAGWGLNVLINGQKPTYEQKEGDIKPIVDGNKDVVAWGYAFNLLSGNEYHITIVSPGYEDADIAYWAVDTEKCMYTVVLDPLPGAKTPVGTPVPTPSAGSLSNTRIGRVSGISPVAGLKTFATTSPPSVPLGQMTVLPSIHPGVQPATVSGTVSAGTNTSQLQQEPWPGSQDTSTGTPGPLSSVPPVVIRNESQSPAAGLFGTGGPDTGTAGSLSVASTPSGAAIFIDGVQRGVSPATIPDIAPGNYTLLLRLDGYTDHSAPVTITAGRTQTYTAMLLKPAAPPGLDIVATFWDWIRSLH